jgi:hypothetical protein
MAQNGRDKPNGGRGHNRIAGLIAPSTELVTSHTPAFINDRIQRQIAANIDYYREAGREAIETRLAELEEEWDVERVLEIQAAGLTVLSALLGLRKRRWLLVSGLAGFFLLFHALEGWAPQLPVLRRLGIRTSHEIDQERYALMRIRDEHE